MPRAERAGHRGDRRPRPSPEWAPPHARSVRRRSTSGFAACCRTATPGWLCSPSAGSAGASARRTAISIWSCCTTGWPGWTRSPPAAGIRSGTPASASTTRCAPSPRRSRSPSDDVKVALGLLDARHIAGDAALSGTLIDAAADQWRRTARAAARRAARDHRRPLVGPRRTRLPAGGRPQGGPRRTARRRHPARHRHRRRHRRAAPGGTGRPPRLLDVRDALHTGDRPAGRPAGRPGTRPRSPNCCELDDGDALLRRVAGDARTIATPSTTPGGPPTGSAAGGAAAPVARHPPPGGPRRRRARRRAGAGPYRHRARPDPSLSLRVAAAAAVTGLPIARATCEWLAAFCPPLPPPWPPQARDALITLLGAGPGLLPAWETCDRYGLVDGWLPRVGPDAQPAAAQPGAPLHPGPAPGPGRGRGRRAYTREVDRPDLLLLGGLPARRRQGAARRPQRRRRADRRRHRHPDRPARPTRRR